MLNESDLRRILYMKNLMLEDEQSTLGWRAITEQVGPGIRQSTPDKPSFFAQWSQTLKKRLEAKHRIDLDPQFRERSFSKPGVVGLIAAIFIIGLVSNYFGSRTEVNLWLNSFTAFLFWNMGIYLFLFISWVIHPRSSSKKGPLLPLLSKGAHNLIEKLKKHGQLTPSSGGVPAMLARIQGAFRQDWFQQFTRHHHTRIAMYLHWLALILTLGIIAGMYFRGFATAYQFTWDSTFIPPEAREFWVKLFFGPVVWIARPLFPEGLPAIEANNGAAWIHLFSGAAFLYILLPRLILALFARRQLRRLRKIMQLPFHEQTWHSIYAESDLQPVPLHVVFYSYSPEEKQVERLIGALKKTLPGTFKKGSNLSISWGDTQLPSLWDDEPGLTIILFNGAQTPEEEVHGEFCKDLSQRLAQAPKDCALLFMVDSQKISLDRKSQRQASWEQLFHAQEIDTFAWISLSDIETKAIPLSIRDTVIRVTA